MNIYPTVRLFCFIIVIVITLSLNACSSAPFHQKFVLGTDNDQNRVVGLAVDARQRSAYAIDIDSSNSPMGQVKPKQILCAEPSPDVAVAIAEAFSLGLSGSVVGKGEVAGALSSATSESLAQLGQRTATVQLLRDLLYRSCEAYANGAITDASYAALLSGIDEFTTTLFLAEAAAGTTSGQGALITGGKIEVKGDAVINTSPPDANIPAATPPDTNTPAVTPPDTNTPVRSANSITANSSANVNQPTGTPGLIGTKTGPSQESAAQIAKIHEQFMKGRPGQSLMVACLVAMDRRVMRKSEDKTLLTRSVVSTNTADNRPTYVETVDIKRNDLEQFADPLLSIESAGPDTPFIKLCNQELPKLLANMTTKNEITQNQITADSVTKLTTEIKNLGNQMTSSKESVDKLKESINTISDNKETFFCKDMIIAAAISKDDALLKTAISECAKELE